MQDNVYKAGSPGKTNGNWSCLQVTATDLVENSIGRRRRNTPGHHLLDGVHLPVESSRTVVQHALSTDFLAVRYLMH